MFKNSVLTNARRETGELETASGEDELLGLLSLIHTKMEHRLYCFLYAEARRAMRREVVFSNTALLRSGIENLSSVRRAADGLASKLSIDRRAVEIKKTRHRASCFVVYDPSEVLERRSASSGFSGPGEPSVNSTFATIARLSVKFGLSRREADVLRLCIDGLTNAEIGNRLFVQEETIKFHMRNIFQKLEVKRRAALISLVLRATD